MRNKIKTNIKERGTSCIYVLKYDTANYLKTVLNSAPSDCKLKPWIVAMIMQCSSTILPSSLFSRDGYCVKY